MKTCCKCGNDNSEDVALCGVCLSSSWATVDLAKGFANYEEAALLWLHQSITQTLSQYNQLGGTEGDAAQRFGVPLWKVVAPAIERELTSRSIAFASIKFAADLPVN